MICLKFIGFTYIDFDCKYAKHLQNRREKNYSYISLCCHVKESQYLDCSEYGLQEGQLSTKSIYQFKLVPFKFISPIARLMKQSIYLSN